MRLIPDQSEEVVHFTVMHLKAKKYMVAIKPRRHDMLLKEAIK